MTDQMDETAVVEVDLASMTLEELAARANAEHTAAAAEETAAEAAMTRALQHAIRAGEALLAAQERVEYGSWTRWQYDNIGFNESAAAQYMRLAEYQSDIAKFAASADSPLGVMGAIRLISGRPRRTHSALTERREAAQSLVKSGVSPLVVAETIGVAEITVRAWTDKDVYRRRLAYDRRRQHEHNQAMKALREREDERRKKKEREKRNALAKAAGGIEAKAYGEIRINCDTLHKGLAQATPETRPEWREALALAHRIEDKIVAIMRATRTSGG